MTDPDVLRVDCEVTLGAFQLKADFATGPGITVVLGPSGAGKTTLLNLISGLLKPDRGSILINGHIVCDTQAGIFVRPHQRRTGMVFQDAQLFPHLSVAQNLAFGGWFSKQKSGPPREHVIEVLGIGHLLSRRPTRLSGGERSRVALARAVLSSPQLLLMDEPLAALDQDKRSAILELIERIRDEFGVPILYVTHAVDEAERLADRTLRVENGVVREAV